MYVCIYVCLYVCMYVCVCLYVCIHECIQTFTSVSSRNIAVETSLAYLAIEARGVILAVEALSHHDVAGRTQAGVHVAITFTLLTLATLQQKRNGKGVFGCL